MTCKLSPSKIHFISQCKLRFILSSQRTGGTSHSYDFNRYSFLGILLHAVLEDFIKNGVAISEFEKIWSRQLNHLIDKFDIAENLQLNLEYQLPYYIIKKEKLRNFIDNLLNKKRPRILSEVPIEGTYISGFADLIDEDPLRKKINIIDLKTGPIWKLSKGEIVKLKEGYRIQLLTYGTAYWEKGYKAEDITCTIQGLSEDEHIEMKFKSEEYDAHQKFLKVLIDEIEGAELNSNINSFALPSIEACIYCEHTMSCSALQGAVKADESLLEAPFVIIHEINCEFDDLNSKINITTNGGVTSIHRIPNEVYLKIKKEVNLGASIFVQGLYVLSQTHVKYWTRYSSFKAIQNID